VETEEGRNRIINTFGPRIVPCCVGGLNRQIPQPHTVTTPYSTAPRPRFAGTDSYLPASSSSISH